MVRQTPQIDCPHLCFAWIATLRVGALARNDHDVYEQPLSLGLAPCAYPRYLFKPRYACFHILGFIAGEVWMRQI